MFASASTLAPARNPWTILLLVCVAQFMVILDGTIVNVALPSIQDDLGFGQAELAWVVNSYVLMFGGFLLLGGRAADMFGRRRLFIIGVTVFTVASLLNGLASSPAQLIVFRGLQGLGAALVSPAALSIVTTTFAEGKERTKALGVWAAIAGGGGAVGLIFGGILVEAFSWPWVFIINVPVGIAAVIAAPRIIPESRAGDVRDGFDLAGAATVTGGLIALVYAIVEAGESGWGASSTLCFGALAAALLVAFVVIERRHSAPLVRLGILRVRSIFAANLMMLLGVAGMFAMFFFTTIYLQDVRGYSPLEAGLAFLPFTAGIIAGSTAAQSLIGRLGVRLAIAAGLVLIGIGLLLMTRISIDGGYVTQVLPAMTLVALGSGMVFVPVTLLATSGVDQDDQGLASGLFNTSQQFGAAIGLAVLSTLAASRTDSLLAEVGAHPSSAQQTEALVSGFHLAFLVGSLLMFAAAVVTAVLVRRDDVAAIDSAQAVPAAA